MSFPLIISEGVDPKKVIEIIGIVAIRGMNNNNGTPTELTIYKYVKGKKTETFVYRLVQ